MKSNYNFLLKNSIIGLIATIFIYALSVITKPIITPEMGILFVMHHSVLDLPHLLEKFASLSEAWYRPVSLYLIPFFLWQIIDLHNIAAIKIITISVLLLNGYVATELAKKIFNSCQLERIITFALIVTHPTYYVMVYGGDGIYDLEFIIFINLFLICFLTLLESGVKNKIFEEKPLVDKNKWFLAFLSTIFVALTVLSHERGAAIFLMIFCLCIFYYWSQISLKKLKLEKFTSIVVCVSALIALTYVFFVYGSKGHQTGYHYRTDIELEFIIPNIVKVFELPFRVFFLPMQSFYDSHNEIGFNLFAAPFLLALISFLFVVFKGSDKKEKNRAAVVMLLFLCSLPIPIVFGGKSWHFFPAAMFISILTGRAIYFWLMKLDKNVYLQTAIIIVFFGWISVATVRGINQELAGNFIKFLTMIDKASNDKVLNGIDFIPEVVYYDTGEWEENNWAFGGQGKLFRYIYNDPKIIEIALVHGKVFKNDRFLCEEAMKKKKVLSFAFEPASMKWSAIENKGYCKIN